MDNGIIMIKIFLPARRYTSADNSDRNVSVRPSVRLSVRHAPVLCQNEES